jgi:hypothetical protein
LAGGPPFSSAGDPHCAERCELDHRHAWEDGGHTNADNLQALSVRHHHQKHDAGWNSRRLPDGSTEWTSPDGHVYRKPPQTYPIDRTLDPPEVAEHDYRTPDVDPPPL